ncbi:response regulator transcription factor [uncultured Thermanaerothrix sp.]|uniref:response regulator transcription factor n=1 Tax=uncultured Thermanaerothrix sp. TaxID=1195149 RepID=UPI0026119BA3|nr:response regulator transcription factor [uncultured Thermanaerothrix sp.]
MKPKLLVVDDDPTLLRFLRDYLQDEGYTVLTATGGAEALRVAYREHPHLVLLDVMMPGMDGWQVTARLRELSDVPIILLTAKNTEADKLRGFRLGVDDYITKPFSFAELKARIQAVLNRARRSPATETPRLRLGELEIDFDRREVRRQQQIIPLTPTEFRLLEVLVRAQGRAVAEEELLREVWGTHRTEDTALIRRYIWLLRKKIEPKPDTPRYILTVRGYGYRLEEGETA